MKKITTLVIAVMAAASASASLLTPEVSVADAAKYATEVKLESSAARTVSYTSPRSSSVSSRGAADISGNWVGMYYHSTNSTYAVNNFTIAAAGADSYTISNFWNQLAFDGVEHKSFSARMETREVLFDGETQTKDILIIPGEAKSIAGTLNGKNVYVILAQLANGKVSVFKEDIEMVYDNGTLVMPYDENSRMGIAMALPGSSEGSFSILNFYELRVAERANGMLQGELPLSSTETEDYSCGFFYEEKSYNDNEKQLNIYGFGGFNGHPSMFIEGDRMVFYSQTAGTFYYDSSNYDIYIITTPDGQNVDQKVVGAITESDGTKYVGQFNNIIFYVLGLQQTYFGLNRPVITVGEDVAGISSVAADVDSSNLPVVYYNLQGRIVNEPAPGQIVIRRQGNEAAKIIVK